jgi:dolichol-phosphate mannosyltransferase
MPTKLSIIVPCYGNEKNLPTTCPALIANEKNFGSGQGNLLFEYVMIDDGSVDGTFAELQKFKNNYPDKVKIVKLAGNFGMHNALQAGMTHATGDCNIVIAADLQEPIELMPKMVEYWQKGIKLVIANRSDRDDGAITTLLATTYHKLIRKFALKDLPDGGFDYCLFDTELKNKILEMNEKNTNTLYLLLLLKYDFVAIPYLRSKRTVGKSTWTLKKRLNLFIDTFASFSYAPLRFIAGVGLAISLLSLVMVCIIIVDYLRGNVNIRGWTSIMAVFLLISGFQTLSLGILGEYLWRNLEATRKRPTFVVEKVL